MFMGVYRTHQTSMMERFFEKVFAKKLNHICLMGPTYPTAVYISREMPHLIVPVGDATGELNPESTSGILIRSGNSGRGFICIFVYSTGQWTNEVNHTFIFVDGNRMTHLK